MAGPKRNGLIRHLMPQRDRRLDEIPRNVENRPRGMSHSDATRQSTIQAQQLYDQICADVALKRSGGRWTFIGDLLVRAHTHR